MDGKFAGLGARRASASPGRSAVVSAPQTPDTLEKSQFLTLRLQRDENEALASRVDEAEARLQQALRESAERFLEIRRLTDEKDDLKRRLSDTHDAFRIRLEAIVTKHESCRRLRVCLLLWASWTCGVRRTECILRRMPCRSVIVLCPITSPSFLSPLALSSVLLILPALSRFALLLCSHKIFTSSLSSGSMGCSWRSASPVGAGSLGRSDARAGIWLTRPSSGALRVAWFSMVP